MLELLVIMLSSKINNCFYNEDSCMCIFRKCKTELTKTCYAVVMVEPLVLRSSGATFLL